ncbi:hypothetical protein [Micromonospora sp. CPCC 206061]|uniref:hypothetical protein n=1 Tax=Micromonospora sp. CPCC 206061 TaxID=3122410 RepID=UPI002FF2F481
MGDWFRRTIVETGRLPLFCFFVGMVVGFGFIRTSVRMIRAQVRWWPGNLQPGGLHIHHVVFGVVFMLVAGVAALAMSDTTGPGIAVAATVFGVGAALTLDEFALILRLEDVYWSEQGRTSVDAVFVAVSLTGLLLLGVRPIGLDDFRAARVEGGGAALWWTAFVSAVINFSFAAITLLKGKIWTGIIGLFLPILILVGAIRLARPHSPWSRWRYHRPGARAARKLARAERREDKVRAPLARAGARLQDLVAGQPSSPDRRLR